MELDLAGKVVLITGSSRGLGATIAASFIDELSYVVINGRTAEGTEKTARALGERAVSMPADMTQPAACEALIDRLLAQHGRLDVLVCNVGSGVSARPGQETASAWHDSIAINLYSTTNIVHAAADALEMSNGSVVCISSICGHAAVPGAPVTYSASKAGLNAFVKGIARPFADRSIRINAVSPGNLLFAGSVWDQKQADDPAAVEAMLYQEVALKRLGKAEEIANFVLFLASERASFATGAVFTVDGGQVR